MRFLRSIARANNRCVDEQSVVVSLYEFATGSRCLPTPPTNSPPPFVPPAAVAFSSPARKTSRCRSTASASSRHSSRQWRPMVARRRWIGSKAAIFSSSLQTTLPTSSAMVVRQRSAGCVVDLLTPQELKTRFPSMNVDDLGAGAHTPHDGWCDPKGLHPGEGGSPESLGRTPLDPRFRGEDGIWEHHSCAGTFRHSWALTGASGNPCCDRQGQNGSLLSRG